MVASNCCRRNSSPSHHGCVAHDELMSFDVAALVGRAVLEFAYPRLDVRNNVDDRKHSKLPIPHALDFTSTRLLKVNLSLDHVELQVRPMVVASPDKQSAERRVGKVSDSTGKT